VPTTTRIIDWVSFTLKEYTSVEPVLALLGLDFLPCERGMMGYKAQLAADGGSIRVLSEGTTGMGVHVQISGSGCRLLEGMGKVTSWGQFLSQWRELGAVVTRLDLALDSYRESASLPVVRRHLANRSATSRWRQVEDRSTTCLQSGEAKGSGIYFGSASSDVRLRIYDKRLEQLQKGVPVGSDRKYWTRFEFQCRSDRADALAALIADGQIEAAFGVLRGYLDFRAYRLDSNPSMAPVARWWLKLMDCEKLSLHVGEVVKESLARVHRWIERQVAPALALLVEVEGGDVFGALAEYAVAGRSRYRERHRLILNAVGA
jgi:phage replication initiation protein